MMFMYLNHKYVLNLAVWNLVALVSTQRLQLLREEPSLSAFDQQTIVNAHNHYRRLVGASNMQLMQWDADLQKASEDSSRSCPVFRSQQKYSPKGAWRYISENVYGANANENFNATKAIDAWFSEGQTLDCRNGEYTCCEKACNDYSQIVWAKSNRIGCGVSLCAQNRFEADTYLLVCSYGPAGNMFGERAYETGTACSKCSFEAPDCARGLCAKCDDDSSRQMCQYEPFYQALYGRAAGRGRFPLEPLMASFAVVSLAAWQSAMLV